MTAYTEVTISQSAVGSIIERVISGLPTNHAQSQIIGTGSLVFTLKVINVFHRHSSAAMEIPPVHPGFCAFIGVHPPWPEKWVPDWRVRKFEIAREKIAEWFAEEDLVDSQLIKLESLEEVEEKIKNWGVETAQFAQSLNADYPF